jgi:hypothetical protein
MSVPVVLERVTRTALLGIRLWDRVTASAVSDGLELVEVGSGVRALPNRSDVFVLHDLPGLRESSFGAGDAEFWASPPAAGVFTLELADRDGRFLPFRFHADAPTRDFLTETCGLPAMSPPDALVAGVPLFSAPARQVPAGTAVVRADLWDAGADAPAAWAVLEVGAPGGPTYHGVADAAGRVAVLLPYPEPPWHGSSPPPGSRALSDQTWSLELSARYSPAAASPPLPDPGSGVPPDLCAVLTQQPATLVATASPFTPLASETLAFGRELVLRTTGRHVLLVFPA